LSDPEWALDNALTRALERGETGIQVAAYVGDVLVVERSAGLADPDRAKPVDEDALFLVFSASKGITATAVHILADRGRLDYDERVADCWPEFAQGGKDEITIGQVLAHAAAVPQVPIGTTAEDMADLGAMCESTARLIPLWPPGDQVAYHAYTFGWILAEVVRRKDVEHRSFAQFVQDEICDPLEIEGMWFGLPDARFDDVAVVDDSEYGESRSALLRLAIPEHLTPSRRVFMRPEMLRGVHPAAGAVCNARALARLYAALCPASPGNVVLSAPARQRVLEAPVDAWDACLETSVRRTLGYVMVSESGGVMGDPATRAFGHVGAGGSIGWADPSLSAGFAILKNKMTVVRGGDHSALVDVAEALRALTRSASSHPEPARGGSDDTR
jgi:CubicO group peptidase (beta-lactamase class C family)